MSKLELKVWCSKIAERVKAYSLETLSCSKHKSNKKRERKFSRREAGEAK